MKLLTLIIITLAINFSVLMKSSFFTSPLNSIELVDIIDQQSTKLYSQGKVFINDIKNSVMIKLSKYGQIVKVVFLGKSFIKENRSMLSEKKRRHSSGKSNNDITKKDLHCFI
jgi:hypothetical protein